MLRTRNAQAVADGGRPSTRQHDALLVGQVAAGDSNAFEALYRTFYPRLRRFIERMTRRPQLVDEILDDTMLVVWSRAGTYDRSSSVSTWIFAIAFRKSLKTLKALDEPVDADADEAAMPETRGPYSQVLGGEARVLLGRALDLLSAEQRAVVELTYFHGCGYREIAEILDCPVDTVKTRMFHARRKLKALLAANREEMP
jgi:RNA polymerase sigma-70 factor (ECF subfamily)